MPADRFAAGLILRLADEARWLLLRARSHGEWGVPKGHLDPGEDFLAAALRETAEECGIALVAVTAAPQDLVYTLADGATKVVRYYPAVTRQREPRLSREHTQWEWLSRVQAIARLPHENMQMLFRELSAGA